MAETQVDVECVRCDGAGWWIDYDFYGMPTQVQCPDCLGRGVITLELVINRPDTEDTPPE